MSGSAYDVHPYLLLNLSDKYDGLTTYAHEWGHAMHSLLANKAQPFETAGYPTFTAEIASTCHELLLANYMLGQAKTKQEKLFYLGQLMENYRGTFYRQTMFAEFQLAIHDLAEKGEGLSGEKMTAINLALLKKYHGPNFVMDPALWRRMDATSSIISTASTSSNMRPRSRRPTTSPTRSPTAR
jgi:oligoendopeptidase F